MKFSTAFIVFGFAIAPIVSAIVMSYFIGRSDGRRAEQRRRLSAAQGIAALKHKQGSVRL